MPNLAVIASGMVTAVGFNASATLAALRAGISGIEQIPWKDPKSGERLRGAKVHLPQWWQGVEKLADLAAPAIYECLNAAAPELAENIPILLGVANEARPGGTDVTQSLLEAIEFRLALTHHRESRVYPHDQAGCANALNDAHAILENGQAKMCVIAGVDSFLDRPTLHSLIERRRLMTSNNSNGFFPGEAGCAILVSLAGATPYDELQLIGIGWGNEAATIESTEPFRGVGLTRAIRGALETAGIALKDVAYRITDLSGEHYKFKEALFALTRLDHGPRVGVLDLWHPIEYVGEIGAAILPCILGWALHAQQYGYAPGPFALCHVGSDDGQRAAIVVSAQINMEQTRG